MGAGYSQPLIPVLRLLSFRNFIGKDIYTFLSISINKYPPVPANFRFRQLWLVSINRHPHLILSVGVF